jgi:hypothetical protein
MTSVPEKASSGSSRGKPLAFASAPPGDNGGQEIPQLPASDSNADIPTIKLGETIKLAGMGPVIINTDGTTRRIDNWNELTDKEKEVTFRRISKRNEERRKALMEQANQQQEDESNDV